MALTHRCRCGSGVVLQGSCTCYIDCTAPYLVSMVTGTVNIHMYLLTMCLRSAEGESMAWARVTAAPCKGALALWLASADCTNCVTFSCSAPVPPAAAG